MMNAALCNDSTLLSLFETDTGLEQMDGSIVNASDTNQNRFRILHKRHNGYNRPLYCNVYYVYRVCTIEDDNTSW